MIKLWQYIFGYLLIKIEGDNSEQILNKAALNGINIWNLKYRQGYIFGNVSAKNFLKLKEAKKGIKGKIIIVNKYGLNFYFKKHKNRTGFFAGLILFFSILIFLSNFVWIIKVEGNEVIKHEEIINSCEKIGIYEGLYKKKINNKYDAQRLQLVQKGISWCSLNLEGCVLTVNLSETKVSEENQMKSPSNLKASIEGEICKIDVTAGNVLVKVGDTVSKGDLLVSGVSQNSSGTHFVGSKGKIIAKTKRVFSANGNYVQKVKTATNNIKKRYTINIFNLKIPLFLGNIKKPNNYKITINNLLLFGKETPIKTAIESYNLTEETTVTYDKEALINILNQDIENQIKKFELINSNETKREIIDSESGVLLKVYYECEENIALSDGILFDNVN